VCGSRLGVWQACVNEDLAQEEHRAGLAMQRQRVFAAPAKAAALCQFNFQHGRGIGEHTVPQVLVLVMVLFVALVMALFLASLMGDLIAQAFGQLLQTLAQDLVVVATSRVHRDHGLSRLGQPSLLLRQPVVWRVAWQVVHARGDHAHGAFNQFSRPGTFEAMALHVVHVAMKTRLQPSQQTRLGLVQINAGHADLGKSQLLRPLLQLAHQLQTVVQMPQAHAPILETRTLRWPDEGRCAACASQLAQQGQLAQAQVDLVGPLGAGKTSFVRHLLRALGVAGRIKSPTYTVMEPYHADQAHGGFAISHFDFYRFNDPREWEDAGLREVFAAPGLKLCEWPQNAAALLPQADLQLHITPLDDEVREVLAAAFSPRGQALLASAACR
jgi:tRNA threonylcarbamoyladenosine biosynthesis protein TsaE